MYNLTTVPARQKYLGSASETITRDLVYTSNSTSNHTNLMSQEACFRKLEGRGVGDWSGSVFSA
jgi:hypothetical protein